MKISNTRPWKFRKFHKILLSFSLKISFDISACKLCVEVMTIKKSVVFTLYGISRPTDHCAVNSWTPSAINSRRSVVDCIPHMPRAFAVGPSLPGVVSTRPFAVYIALANGQYTVYRVFQKTDPLVYFDDNFDKYGPILTIFSLLQQEIHDT